MKRPSLSMTTSMIVLATLVFSCAGEKSTKTAPTPEKTTAARPTQPAPPANPAPQGESEASKPSTDQGLAEPLLAWAEAEPEDGKAPLRVQFNAEVEGGTRPFKITWDFGDGSPTSSEMNPVHVYKKPGEYEADLSVDDSAGDSDSDWVDIDVE